MDINGEKQSKKHQYERKEAKRETKEHVREGNRKKGEDRAKRRARDMEEGKGNNGKTQRRYEEKYIHLKKFFTTKKTAPGHKQKRQQKIW